MSLVVVNNMLLVEKYDKIRKRNASSGNPFTDTTTSNNLGTIKYSSSEEYPAGMNVYFGTKYEVILVEGAELIAMSLDNVIAKVMEPSNEHQG